MHGSWLRERRAHGVGRGPRRAVDAVEARLEAGSGGVVAEPEDVHLRDVGVTRRPAHDLAVHRRLMDSVVTGDVLEPV